MVRGHAFAHAQSPWTRRQTRTPFGVVDLCPEIEEPVVHAPRRRSDWASDILCTCVTNVVDLMYRLARSQFVGAPDHMRSDVRRLRRMHDSRPVHRDLSVPVGGTSAGDRDRFRLPWRGKRRWRGAAAVHSSPGLHLSGVRIRDLGLGADVQELAFRCRCQRIQHAQIPRPATLGAIFAGAVGPE